MNEPLMQKLVKSYLSRKEAEKMMEAVVNLFGLKPGEQVQVAPAKESAGYCVQVNPAKTTEEERGAVLAMTMGWALGKSHWQSLKGQPEDKREGDLI